MAGAVVYIKHRSGRQRICSEAELDAMKAEGWVETGRVEAAKAPAKKVAAKKKAASKKAE